MGVVNEGSNGQQCAYWNETILSDSYQTVISNMNSILTGRKSAGHNQCRNVDYDVNGPWCFNTLQERIYCDVARCGTVLMRGHTQLCI